MQSLALPPGPRHAGGAEYLPELLAQLDAVRAATERFRDHDAWHLHDMMKISMTATEGRPLLRWLTERRIAKGRTQWSRERPELTMVHAWVWMEHPDGHGEL